MANTRFRNDSPALRAECFGRWGTQCWLGLPQCTGHATELDHIMPFVRGGGESVENLRPACRHCNASRHNRVISGYGARLHVLIYPPSYDLDALAVVPPSSVPISFAKIAESLGMSTRHMSDGERRIVMAAYRSSAYAASCCTSPIDVWMLRTTWKTKAHPELLSEFIQLGYDIRVMDVADTTCATWRALAPTQGALDDAMAARARELAFYGLNSMTDNQATRTPFEW